MTNNKIIALTVFVSAAIMTSLFLYHIKNKPEPMLSPEVGLIFPAPREVKKFELITADNRPFTEKNLYQHWTLLFFGFTHCSNVCPTTLDMMSRVYGDLQKTYPNLQVALISVDPDRDTPESLDKYTKAYHSAFIGVTGKVNELRKLQSQLGIYAARDESGTASNYQVQHTSSILLINPQGKWAAMYKYGLTPQVFKEAVERSIREGT